MDAEAAENGASDTLAVCQREERADTRTHGIAHHVGATDAQIIEQRAHITGHARAVIGGRIIELAGLTVAAIIKRNDATVRLLERPDPAGAYPVDLRGGSKPVHENDGFALAFIEERDLDAVVLKTAGMHRNAKLLGGPQARMPER